MSAITATVAIAFSGAIERFAFERALIVFDRALIAFMVRQGIIMAIIPTILSAILSAIIGAIRGISAINVERINIRFLTKMCIWTTTGSATGGAIAGAMWGSTGGPTGAFFYVKNQAGAWGATFDAICGAICGATSCGVLGAVFSTIISLMLCFSLDNEKFNRMIGSSTIKIIFLSAFMGAVCGVTGGAIMGLTEGATWGATWGAIPSGTNAAIRCASWGAVQGIVLFVFWINISKDFYFFSFFLSAVCVIVGVIIGMNPGGIQSGFGTLEGPIWSAIMSIVMIASAFVVQGLVYRELRDR